jgi:hypothetical protein
VTIDRALLRKAAIIAAAVVGGPITLTILAVRGCMSFTRDARAGGWHAVTPDRILWVCAIASLIVVGAYPKSDHAPDDIGTTVFLGCAITLFTRWVQRRRQQQWRETGGRMTLSGPPRTEPTVTELAERIDQQDGRLDAQDEAWAAWWQIHNEENQRPNLRVIRGERDGRNAGLCAALAAFGLGWGKDALDHGETLGFRHAQAP